MFDLPTYDRFVSLLNSQFQIEYRNESIVMELTEVSEQRLTRRFETFSLVFRGPGNLYIPQATYRFNHSEQEGMDLLIVPIDRDEQGLYYEAVISRSRDQKQV